MFTIKLQNDKKNPTLQVPDSIRKKYIKQVSGIFVAGKLPTVINISYFRRTATSEFNATMVSLK